MAIWSGRQTLHILDVDLGEISSEQRIPNVAGVHWLGNETVLYHVGNCLWTLDVLTPDDRQDIGCPPDALSPDYALWNVVPSPGGRWLALVWDDTAARDQQNPLERKQGVGLFDMDTRTLHNVVTFEDPGGIFNTDELLQWSADGQYLLAGFNTFFPREGAFVVDATTLTVRRLPGQYFNAIWENAE